MLLSGSKSVNETKDNEMYPDLIPLKLGSYYVSFGFSSYHFPKKTIEKLLLDTIQWIYVKCIQNWIFLRRPINKYAKHCIAFHFT